ncbi:MAG: hypothetical protein KJ624_04345 [Chloroflexi bacterium]|nr:hypothetical protein [Chloroflexota bacterium]
MKKTFTFNEEDLQELARIALDKDAEGALKLIEEIKAKMKASDTRSCGISAPSGGGPWPQK